MEAENNDLQEEQNINIEGAQEGGQEVARNTAKGRIRKGIGSLKDNIVGAVKGNAKDIFVLKTKLIIYGIIAVLVFFALIVEGDAEETSSTAARVNAAAFAESTTESAKLYNETGSLLLATDAELEEIKQGYFDEIEKTRPRYYESFNIICKGKKSNTVVNKVTHISTTGENSEEKEAQKVDASVSIVGGAALPSDERTIYEHILRTEKYNFNNVVWRSFVKSDGGLTSSSISFSVDSNSKLKYPSDHSGATNADTLDLEFFVNKIRPYLQSWYVPFDLMIGTVDAQDESNLNANFAYEILTSAYHEIVADRYRLEKLDRETNYLVYDKTTTTKTTTRTCNDYEKSTTTITTTTKTTREAGSPCTKNDAPNKCKDAVTQYPETRRCSKQDVIIGIVGCDDVSDSYKTGKMLTCSDLDKANKKKGCSYGVLKKAETSDINTSNTTTETKTYCTDITTETETEEKDIRESKVKNKKDTDTLTYSWNYVISTAKLFDKVVSSTFNFEPYYEYSLDNYNSFIDKKVPYKDMTVEQFRESEQTNSQADSLQFEEADYLPADEVQTTTQAWNDSYVVETIPSGWTKKAKTEQSKEVKKVVTVKKVGKEYTDTYSWADTLRVDETVSGIYNLDSVKDVTGDDLTYEDNKYYNDLAVEKEVNIIDLMNSNNTIYENYLAVENRSRATKNIGIRKERLDIAYNVLTKDLKQLSEKNILMYGNSLNILEGLNLGAIVAAGGVNDALIAVAEQYMGNTLSQMESLDKHNVFGNADWCAMFVSHCMREVEAAAGVKIPIATFGGCGSIWNDYIATKTVGVYDVAEWVEINQR